MPPAIRIFSSIVPQTNAVRDETHGRGSNSRTWFGLHVTGHSTRGAPLNQVQARQVAASTRNQFSCVTFASATSS
jgi:hypothetical protein